MHNLIIGNSGSGKTELCKYFASKHNGNISVYDPLESRGWPKEATKYASPSLFLESLKTEENAMIFVDEAKTLWEFDQREADALLYRRRHQGLLVFLIAQRTRMVPPNARNQCSKVFAFRQQKQDADTLANEYVPELAKCTQLKPHHFIASDGFNAEHYYIDFSGDKKEVKKESENNVDKVEL